MNTNTETAHPHDVKSQYVDVWSRTSPKYRRRAALMLLLLALLFAGLCCFMFWLRTGVYCPWQHDAYSELMARSFRPTGGDQVTLNDFLTSPISVYDVQIHGVIMGLLFASLCSVPILVALLYRYPYSLPFGVMVVFLASMPWLGITVMLGCGLTTLKPFRFQFRYASALVALIPVGVYFVSASWEPAGASAQPVRHLALLYAPWVLALLSSCVICAVGLGSAKLIGYRPGGIPPVLAMLFAIPVILFHTQVGRDELEFRVLVQEIGPISATMFRTVDVGELANRIASHRWSETQGESFDQLQREALEEQTDQILLEAEENRLRAVAMCDAFLEKFPDSHHAASVLFLKGRALDQQIQEDRLLRDRRAEFRSDLPSGTSQRTWEVMVKAFPTNPLTSSAMHKLAILKARQGKMDEAVRLLDDLLARFDISQASTQPVDVPESQWRATVFRKKPAYEGLGVDSRIIVKQARELRELIIACRNDERRPLRDVFETSTRETEDELLHPLQLMLTFDRSSARYAWNLENLARLFPESETAGYVRLELAGMERAVSRRIQRYEDAAEALAGRPSGAVALFRLGEALQRDSLIDEARTIYDHLSRSYPNSFWTQEAQERLSSLSMLDVSQPGDGS